MPENTITSKPVIDSKSKTSPKKIYPKIAAQINCVKKNGLIILVYFPAIWKAYVYKITQVNNKDPPIHTNSISLKDIKIGSNIKIIAENNVIGNKW